MKTNLLYVTIVKYFVCRLSKIELAFNSVARFPRQAASAEDASDGMVFMQEMIELSKTQGTECE